MTDETKQGFGRRVMQCADEYDVHLARRIYCWTQRTGATAKVKRRVRRRERHLVRQSLRTAGD